jgi:hypothetical protein
MSVKYREGPFLKQKETEKASESERPPVPCCPYCQQEIGGDPSIGLYVWIVQAEQAGQLMIIATYCPHCRCILHQQLAPALGLMQEPGRIAIPS